MNLWIECYNGRIPTTDSCFKAGWGICDDGDDLHTAYRKIQEWFYNRHSKTNHLVLVYPEDRCAKKFSAKDPIIGVFG